MSRAVIGYEGEGKARRPVYDDEGPARARASSGPDGSGDPDGHSIIGSPVIAEASTMGAGPVVRRMETDAEHATRTTADRLAEQEAERARRDLRARHTASHPVRERPTRPPERPVAPVEEGIHVIPRDEPVVEDEVHVWPTGWEAKLEANPSLVRTPLVAVTSTADQDDVGPPPPIQKIASVRYLSDEDLADHRPDLEAHPLARVQDAFMDVWFELVEPGCETCAHAVVCSIRPTIPDAIELIVPRSLPAGISPALVRTLDLSCIHHLPVAAPAQAPARKAAAAKPSKVEYPDMIAAAKARELALIIAIRDTGTLTKGAKAAGIPLGSVAGIIRRLRERGDLPADVAEMIERNRTYKPRPTA